MRMQRIRHASCVSAALAWPNGVLFAFPHYSDLTTRRNAMFFNWGQDLMERRAEISGGYLPLDVSPEAMAAFVIMPGWITSARGYLSSAGCVPCFPKTSRDVRSYFRSADGEDFRYVQYPWFGVGRIQGWQGKMRYGRIHGVYEAVSPGAIYGWLMYNENVPRACILNDIIPLILTASGLLCFLSLQTICAGVV